MLLRYNILKRLFLVDANIKEYLDQEENIVFNQIKKKAVFHIQV